MSCEIVKTECLSVGDRVPITLDFTQLILRPWRAAGIYALNDKIRGSKPGFQFNAGNAGQAGLREPRWPTTLGGTVVDGSITWTAEAVAVDSLVKTLVSATWSADASITISGTAVDTTEQTAIAYVQPSAAGVFNVTVTPTFSDTPAHAEAFIVELTVS